MVIFSLIILLFVWIYFISILMSENSDNAILVYFSWDVVKCLVLSDRQYKIQLVIMHDTEQYQIFIPEKLKPVKFGSSFLEKNY